MSESADSDHGEVSNATLPAETSSIELESSLLEADGISKRSLFPMGCTFNVTTWRNGFGDSFRRL